MVKYTTIMRDLLSHFPKSEFTSAVDEFKGDRKARSLTCNDILQTAIYGQIIQAYSFRDIESSLIANADRLPDCGMKPVKRSTFCDALEKRDHRIFERGYNALVEKANMIAGGKKRRFKNPLKIIDATTIDVCLNRFPWAKFRKTKGALKLHVALNGDFLFPEQVKFTTGNVHEVQQLSLLHFKENDIVVMDRGYLDYNRLYYMDLSNISYVIRLKSNADIKIVETRNESVTDPVRGDYMIELSGAKAKQAYPSSLRMILYHDSEKDRDFRFLTNNNELSGQEIADIYKARWQVELFFKWIKQNLKIKTFWGTSENAVKIQIWTALILFMLLWIQKAISGIPDSMQRIIQVMKTMILNRRKFEDLFRPIIPKVIQRDDDDSYSLFLEEPC